jgi:hypothetical protein
VVSFRKINSTSILLDVEDKHLIEPCDVPDEFSKHLQSVHSNSCPVVLSTLASSKSLPLTSVNDSDLFKVIKRLRPSKFVRVDDIPGFITKGCTDILVTDLRHIFNLSLSQQNFSTLCKQAAIVPFFIIGNNASFSNYRMPSQ